MHEGKLTRGQFAAWALIVTTIRAASPSKTRPSSRAAKISRFVSPGANASWITMRRRQARRHREVAAPRRSTGLSRDHVFAATAFFPPRVSPFSLRRFRLHTFASRKRSLPSLTELFFKELITLRKDRLREHIPGFPRPSIISLAALTQASRRRQFGPCLGCEHGAHAPGARRRLPALRAKCDILWAQLEPSILLVNPGWPPLAHSSPQGLWKNAKMTPDLNSRPTPRSGCPLVKTTSSVSCSCPNAPSPERPQPRNRSSAATVSIPSNNHRGFAENLSKPPAKSPARHPSYSRSCKKRSRPRLRNERPPSEAGAFVFHFFGNAGAKLPLSVSTMSNSMPNDLSNPLSPHRRTNPRCPCIASTAPIPSK